MFYQYAALESEAPGWITYIRGSSQPTMLTESSIAKATCGPSYRHVWAVPKPAGCPGDTPQRALPATFDTNPSFLFQTDAAALSFHSVLHCSVQPFVKDKIVIPLIL